MEKIQADIQEIEVKIKAVDEKLHSIEDQINSGSNDEQLRKDQEYYREEKRQLRELLLEKERQLREEKRQLREYGPGLSKRCKLDIEPSPAEKLPENSENESVSTLAAKKEEPNNIRECPPYSHWFAIDLYNIYLEAKAQTQTTSQPEEYTFIFRGKNFQIAKSHLADAVQLIKVSSNPNQLSECRGILSDPDMCSSELAFSCLYSRALDRFLFEDPKKGACLHQAPSRVRVPGNKSTLEKVNTCAIILYSDGSPSSPILLADLKNDNNDTACKESALYAINGASQHKGRKFWPVQLGIPTTRECSFLKVYVASNDILYQLPVAEESPYNEALLLTLYVAVNSLTETPINSERPITLPLPKDRDGVQFFNRRVVWYEDDGKKYVCKLYDSSMESWNEPNLELIHQFDHFKEAELHQLSIDGRLSMLRYPYIPSENCEPHDLKHFTGILRCLKKLHDMGYVHGDVRLENIVFTEDDSFLIDFDLARKEHPPSYYPNGYVTSYKVRHPRASPQFIMEKEHDVYSIKKIICSKYDEDLYKFKDIDTLLNHIIQ